MSIRRRVLCRGNVSSFFWNFKGRKKEILHHFLRGIFIFFALFSSISLFSCDQEDKEVLKELNFFVPHAKAELSKDSPENSVNVSWNYCANFDGYVLYRSFTRDGCTETETFGFPNDVTSFFDTTCEPGTEYTYKVSTDYHIFAGMYLHMMLFIPVTSSGDEVKITTMPDSKVCIK